MDALYIWKTRAGCFLILKQPAIDMLKMLGKLDQMFDQHPHCHAVFEAKAEAARDLYRATEGFSA